MTTHDFRPGDVVEWHFTAGRWTVREVCAHAVCLNDDRSSDVVHWVTPNEVTFVSRPSPRTAPTEHPSRSRAASSLRAADPVDHPAHYTDHPSGVECITVAEHMNFNVGNAVKYLWRAGRKGDALTDLRKAAWYVNREIERLTREGGS